MKKQNIKATNALAANKVLAAALGIPLDKLLALIKAGVIKPGAINTDLTPPPPKPRRGRPPLLAGKLRIDAPPPPTRRRVRTDAGVAVMLRKSDVAEMLGVSTYSLDRWIALGKFPRPIYLQPGSPATWRRCDVDAWIEKRRASRVPKRKPRGIVRSQAEETEAPGRSTT